MAAMAQRGNADLPRLAERAVGCSHPPVSNNPPYANTTQGIVMNYRYEWSSPLGPLLLLQCDDQLRGLYFDGHKPAPRRVDGIVDGAAFQFVVTELEEYFAGIRSQFSVPIAWPDSTAFQRSVWTELRNIPYGSTTSYANVADASGHGAGAARAVATAIARNPISIIVPCHRVLGANGKLTGYAGGIPRKRHLLQLEGNQPITPAA